MMLIPKKYYAVLLLLGAVSRIARELQIHTKGTCQISNSAFVIVGVPTSTNDTINFTETRNQLIGRDSFRQAQTLSFFRSHLDWHK